MMHAMNSDLQHAVHLFFSDRIFNTPASPYHRIGMEEIKKEFRKKAMLFHPDRAAFLGKNRGRMEEKFKQISEAYDLLKSAITDAPIIVHPRSYTKASQKQKHPTDTVNNFADRKPKTPPGAATFRKTRHKQPFSSNKTAFDGPIRKHFFFNGMVPQRQLRLGEFLYYNRIISWRTMINAIVWQHRVRPKLGHIATEMNLLAHREILTILSNKNIKESFGSAAVRLGFLDKYKLLVLLGHQRNYGLPIGKYFLNTRILDTATLEKYIFKNRMHNFHHKYRTRQI